MIRPAIEAEKVLGMVAFVRIVYSLLADTMKRKKIIEADDKIISQATYIFSLHMKRSVPACSVAAQNQFWWWAMELDTEEEILQSERRYLTIHRPGLPKILEFDIGFFGQQGDVEFEIRKLAKAVPGTAVVC
ncbi:hypothetical protein Tco_0044835 [Tanacetum coccineum]